MLIFKELLNNMLYYRSYLIRGVRITLPEIDAQQLARGQIVQNQEYLDLLFELLQYSSNEVQEKTWYLLRSLPPSSQLIKQILKFKNITQPSFQSQFVVIILQYFLKLKDKWMSKFLQQFFQRILRQECQYSQINDMYIYFIINWQRNIIIFMKQILKQCCKWFCCLEIQFIQVIKMNFNNQFIYQRKVDQVIIQQKKQINFIPILINLIQELLKCNELEQEDRQIIKQSIIIIIVIQLNNQDLLAKTYLHEHLIHQEIYQAEQFKYFVLKVQKNNQPNRMLFQQLKIMLNTQGNSAQYQEFIIQLCAIEIEESQQYIDYQKLSEQMLQNLINYKSQKNRQKIHLLIKYQLVYQIYQQNYIDLLNNQLIVEYFIRQDRLQREFLKSLYAYI
ncbi:unnamed protein product [Paramecium sonneborni]|uniref:Uncharacterized protein n=1 Tax=Paramecium sonneborni TaxID=65129 RepID=A0A8S1QB92_9CILI|nr:unnamed protein product [Paramecium sonneborni]